MTHPPIHGHDITVQPCDGLAGYYRVKADGQFCGLVSNDVAGWHTIPAAKVGVPSPPVCHAPTCELALSTLVAEVFPC